MDCNRQQWPLAARVRALGVLAGGAKGTNGTRVGFTRIFTRRSSAVREEVAGFFFVLTDDRQPWASVRTNGLVESKRTAQIQSTLMEGIDSQ